MLELCPSHWVRPKLGVLVWVFLLPVTCGAGFLLSTQGSFALALWGISAHLWWHTRARLLLPEEMPVRVTLVFQKPYLFL